MAIDERLRFTISNPPVVHESFGDEAVIVNLNTGAYYSLDKSGLAIWNLISQGASMGEIVDHLSSRYAADRGEILASVAELISSLLGEQLIQSESDAVHRADNPAESSSNSREKIP